MEIISNALCCVDQHPTELKKIGLQTIQRNKKPSIGIYKGPNKNSVTTRNNLTKNKSLNDVD